MPLIDCPECGRGFSQYAGQCPQCGFPNPLSAFPVSHHDRAIVTRQRTDIRAPKEPTYPQAQEPVRQPPPEPEYHPQPAPDIQTVTPEQTQTTTYYAVEEKYYDNSLYGLFHGRTNFWFALCVYYLGGVVLSIVTAVFFGQPQFLLWASAGWAFVGLFVLLWNTRNIEHTAWKWLARVLIVLILLVWLNH
jgi:hypothetical protein